MSVIVGTADVEPMGRQVLYGAAICPVLRVNRPVTKGFDARSFTAGMVVSEVRRGLRIIAIYLVS
jgi:hypothetical protein